MKDELSGIALQRNHARHPRRRHPDLSETPMTGWRESLNPILCTLHCYQAPRYTKNSVRALSDEVVTERSVIAAVAESAGCSARN